MWLAVAIETSLRFWHPFFSFNFFLMANLNLNLKTFFLFLTQFGYLFIGFDKLERICRIFCS